MTHSSNTTEAAFLGKQANSTVTSDTANPQANQTESPNLGS